MSKTCLACCGVLCLLFHASVVLAQPDDAAAGQTTEDVERLVDTLQDPAARERLVGDLKLLLEAQQRDAAGSGAATPTASSILERLQELVVQSWDRLTSVDPLDLAISAAISVGILVGAFLVRWLLVSLLRRLYRRLTVGSAKDPAERRAAQADDAKTVLPTAVSRLVNLIVGVLAIALIADTWGAGVAELLSTNLGARIAETALAVGLILVVTVALWNAAQIVVERLLQIGSRKLDRERTVRRLDTLVPLLTSAVQTTISVFAGLLILSELGVNIGPLLAGAGILGLAVGFGAQTLVKDLITGVTILLEDAATIGDVVEVAGHTGVVEDMRIRIIQLRDLSGIVYMIPYGEVTAVKNYTKDFSYYLFKVGVAYREDTDRVCEVLTEISEDLCGDEQHRDSILEPLQILGVDEFADSAVIIKARMKTVPGQQWAVGREFNRRMKKRFDDEGIEIPFPHSTVYFGEPKEGAAPPMQLALATEQRGTLQKLAGSEEP